MPPKLSQALELVGRGFAVFPLKPGEKTPFTGSHGHLEATTNRAKIQEWWAETPDANIGVSPWGGDRKYLVFDFEGPDKGFDPHATIQKWSEQTGLDIDDAWLVHTRSGGIHAYFEVPGDTEAGSAQKILSGMDIRAAGGYVVGPGSVVDGVPYTAEPWREPALFEPFEFFKKERPKSVAVDELDKPLAVRWARDYLEKADPAVEGDGGDAHTFRVAARVRDLGVSEDTALGLMAAWNERCEPPWDPEELAIKVANAYRYAQNPEGSAAPGDVTKTFGSMLAETSVERDKPDKYKPWTLTELEGEPPPQWLVKKVVPAHGFGLIISPPNQYKSFVAVDLACSVVTQSDWAGFPVVRQAPVVYAAGEGGPGLPYRMQAWAKRMDTALPDELRLVRAVPNFGSPDDVRDFVRAIMPVRPGLVILDTLAMATFGMNENSAEHMGLVLEGVKYIEEKTGSFVIAIHHTAKGQSGGSRGWTGIPAAADMELTVYGKASVRHAQISLSKTRDSERWDRPRVLSATMINVGVDEDGEELLVPAFRYDENATLQAKDRNFNTTLRIKHLTDILKEAQGRVSEQALAKEMANRLHEDEEDEAVLTESAKAAQKWLREHAKAFRVGDSKHYAFEENQETAPVGEPSTDEEIL